MKRAAPELAAASWEWQGPGGAWKAYAAEDAALLERLSSAVGEGGKVSTKALSFASGTLYELDFSAGTQTNSTTGKLRKLRRAPAGEEAASEGSEDAPPPLKKAKSAGDLAFAEHLGKPEAPAAKAKSAWGSDSKIKDPPPLDVADIKKQAGLGAQSKRGWKKLSFGPAVSANKHATHCFEKMLENEQRNCGEWATFYHSYNHAALIYEVQAAIASVLFRFKSSYAPLPRLMRGCFSEIPDAPSMMAEFPSWPDQDHNWRFKCVGICATTSLLAADPEAPPTTVFLHGYAVGALSLALIEGLLTDCGVAADRAKKLTRQIVDLAEKYGLHVGAFGGKASKSGLSGHLLQIFMKRHLVDKYAYASLPMGVPDGSRHPIGKHLMTSGKPHICGQVRIVVHPSAFLQANKVRMYVYSADEEFHRGRSTFQELVTALLSPVLGNREARITAAKGIFGGELPAWFEPDDQREKAVPKKLATSEWK